MAAHRTVYRTCPVAHRTVRCAHRQQPSSTAIWWLRAINTPNHHNSKHPRIMNIAFNTRAIDSTPRHNQSDRSTQSPQINSSALGLVRGSLVFFCCSCLLGLAFFFFSIPTLKCFISKARDTNCVVVFAGSK
jgi:4-amino-4-deoxy-L-arabinose transferase-like glycosyltransferase